MMRVVGRSEDREIFSFALFFIDNSPTSEEFEDAKELQYSSTLEDASTLFVQ